MARRKRFRRNKYGWHFSITRTVVLQRYPGGICIGTLSPANRFDLYWHRIAIEWHERPHVTWWFNGL